MQIVTKNQEGTTTYSQLFDDSKTLNTTISVLMQQPPGDALVTVVTNNGHDLIFRNSSLDTDRLIRATNGIIARQVTKAKAA